MGQQKLMALHIPGQPDAEFYIIDMPNRNDRDWYKQVTSFTWFRERELTRAFPDVSGHAIDWMQYARTLKYTSEHQVHPKRTVQDYLTDFDIDINTVTYCNGVWDFYDKIGYDRKAKTYR